jgi:hypothetical protein
MYMEMRFGLWNVRSLYRVGSVMTVSRELLKVRCSGSAGGQMGEREYTFFYGKGMRLMN